MELLSLLREITDRSSAIIGVTDLSPFPDEARIMKERVDNGLSGVLRFTYSDPDLAANPAVSFPWGSSIVVVAIPYLRDGDGVSEERRVARFADGDRYVELRSLLLEIASTITDAGFRSEVVLDDNKLLDRAVAVRAGVGWHGRSTMVLTPGAGPWILIGSVVTDAVLERSDPMSRSCGTCDACIPACPTNAISDSGEIDARRCIAALLQIRGVIPRYIRGAIGGRVYGCDDCLTSCPPGQRSLRSFSTGSANLDPASLLTLPDVELATIVDHWYVPSRRMRFVRRNALIALGNTGDDSSLDLLEGYVYHEDPLLAQHAAWAVGRIGGVAATAICRSALTAVTDEAVREELVAAVTASICGGVYAEDEPVQEPTIRSSETCS